MHLSKQMTVRGITAADAFEKTLEYVERRGYQLVYKREPNLAFTKREVVDELGSAAELWLSISVVGEHYVTVFLDYQLRPREAGVSSNSRGRILAEIEGEFEELWRMLRGQT